MKTKKFPKKLSLNKKTVASLDFSQMNGLIGGATIRCGTFTAYTQCEVTQCVETCPGCPTNSCPPQTATCVSCNTCYPCYPDTDDTCFPCIFPS